MFLDSAAKNYQEILRDQNKYATFDILANLAWLIEEEKETVWFIN